jgi:hypothetical protein
MLKVKCYSALLFGGVAWLRCAIRVVDRFVRLWLPFFRQLAADSHDRWSYHSLSDRHTHDLRFLKGCGPSFRGVAIVLVVERAWSSLGLQLLPVLQGVVYVVACLKL